MRSLGWLAALLASPALAATSDILFSTQGSTFSGTAGNIVFNGQCFVTPAFQANGAIDIIFLNTNGVLASNISLFITGSAGRIAPNGSDYLLVWFETNASATLLKSAALSNGVLGPISTLSSNVGGQSLSLSAANGSFLCVFHSAESNNTVLARKLNATGAPTADAFAVTSSTQPQVYSSVGTDGTNHLICWMEQNVASNDWRVMAQRIVGGIPDGSPLQVSETNSMRPYATACSFGTNYFVAWSADQGPWSIDPNLTLFYGISNLWRPTVRGRMLSEAATPLRHEFSILRYFHYNTNVAVAFGNGRYLVGCHTWGDFSQRAQPLAADGARVHYAFETYRFYSQECLQPSIAFGAGSFCVVYSDVTGNTHAVICAPGLKPDMYLINLRRTNNAIAVESSVGWPLIETSTNLVNWDGRRRIWELPTITNSRQLFVRQFNGNWTCIEQLRAIDWAKQAWAFDGFQSATSTPIDPDLFGPARYLPQPPACPHNGVYTLSTVADKPRCTITGDTL